MFCDIGMHVQEVAPFAIHTMQSPASSILTMPPPGLASIKRHQRLGAAPSLAGLLYIPPPICPRLLLAAALVVMPPCALLTALNN